MIAEEEAAREVIARTGNMRGGGIGSYFYSGKDGTGFKTLLGGLLLLCTIGAFVAACVWLIWPMLKPYVIGYLSNDEEVQPF